MPGIRRVGKYLQEIAHGLFQDPTFVEKLTATVRTGCEAGDPFFLSLLLKVTDGITEPLVEPSRERYAVMTTDELLTLHGIYTRAQERIARNERPDDRRALPSAPLVQDAAMTPIAPNVIDVNSRKDE